MAEARSGFVYKGKTLLSGIAPEDRAERIVDAVPIKDRTLYFCPSPLYGYGTERFLARLSAEAPRSALLCVEADPVLYELSMKNLPPSLAANSRFRITSVDVTSTDRSGAKGGSPLGEAVSCQGAAAALCTLVRHTWGARVFRRVETIRLSGGWQLFPALYSSLACTLQREIVVDWSNALTLTHLGRRYIRNFISNLKFISRCPSIASLSLGASPALVLGAGPSLDPLLEGLEARFGETLWQPETRPFSIICVDTCLPALRERNIVPDLVVILECQHWNLGDFIGCAGWEAASALDLSALPASGAVLSGGKYLFMTPWTPLRIFDRLKSSGLLPACVQPLGSVGLTATELARRLCGGKIMCGGIDFSFTLDSYHARSTPGQKNKLRRNNRFHSFLNAAAAFGPAAFSAVSKSGFPVRSDPAMRGYRDLFEREFAASPRLFDIAGSGQSLGLKTLSLEETFDILETGKQGGKPASAGHVPPSDLAGKVLTFMQEEKERLILLRAILTGEKSGEGAGLETLVDECDYLWSHFPDYAGAGDSRPGAGEFAAGTPAAVSFLKRLRAEIDPAIGLFDRTMGEI